MENQKSLHMPKKKKTKAVDPCPICSNELHLNNRFTQRVGLLGDYDEVMGWLCPHCSSEFDTENHLVKFMGEDSIRGEA